MSDIFSLSSFRTHSTRQTFFPYEELRYNDEIRLLSIPPRSKRRGNKLEVTIENVRLSSHPLYTAISWTWGKHDKTVDLNLNGHVMEVRSNLRKVIKQIQLEEHSRRVWIDAICINQADTREKNHQVQMMDTVYSNANYVLACLAAKGTKEVLLKAHMRKLYDALQTREANIRVDDYSAFFGNEYFTRRWIIQEISQAKAVHFCCAGQQFPMKLLSDAHVQGRLITRESANRGRQEDLAASQAIKLCQTHAVPRAGFMSLEELLYEYELARCQEAHDRVYALLSMSLQARRYLEVNYSATREELMMSVLQVCAAYETLSPFRVLSFMLFLRQHLDVDSDKLREAVIGTPNSVIQPEFMIRGVLRGTIERLECSTDIEEAAVKIRKNLPMMNTRRSILLTLRNSRSIGHPAAEPCLAIGLDSSHYGGRFNSAPISGSDQCLFSLMDDESSPEFDGKTDIMGFASAPVLPGDEVWQFERTPLAVIARMTPQGVILIARAVLVRDMNDRARWLPDMIESKLMWVRDGAAYLVHTPPISLDWKGLHEFMTWVNFDT